MSDDNITLEVDVEEPVVTEEVVVDEVVLEETSPEVVDTPLEEPSPEVVEEPTPEVVEEPTHEVVEEPSPEVVEEPTPEVVEEPTHEVVEEPTPEVVEEPTHEVVEEPTPEVVEEPTPEVVEEPTPEVVEEPVVETAVVEPVPKLVFVVPYRDRVQHQQFFANHMKIVLEDMEPGSCKIYYIHQTDSREFNRGAMKNIGFLAMKAKYPNDYQNITFVFNDVDTMPFSKNFLNYETESGVVKHFYGYDFSLGGIVSIKGSDFEKVLGFPNFWAWGFEDNLLQKRVLAANIVIDRGQFYPIMDKNIIQMKDGLERLVNRGEFDRYMADTNEGVQSINTLNYNIDETTGFINVTSFFTGIDPNSNQNVVHDLRQGSRPFQPAVMPLAGVVRRRPTMMMGHF
jgi:N-terminal region of glycosyl transferase group 7